MKLLTPSSFSFSKLPGIFFGAGRVSEIPGIVKKFGEKVLILTGSSSLKGSGKFDEITSMLSGEGLDWRHETVSGEPSTELVDSISEKYRNLMPDAVMSIGGGSVIDAGKAVSAMIPQNMPIINFLEGVGNRQHNGIKVPFIAVPTTSGTGSEATKNAVISKTGPGGFKKSLRHENFIPDASIIDPALLLSCPPNISAACGMDAFTQLLEAYVSKKANPMTDLYSLKGMEYIRDMLVPSCESGSGNIEIRSGMALASVYSGIALANAGLGVVHGFASVIGGIFDIPHGVVCGILLGPAVRRTILSLDGNEESDRNARIKYARAGALFLHEDFDMNELDYLCNAFIEKIEEIYTRLKLPHLSDYNITKDKLKEIAENSDNKYNPASLTRKDREWILNRSL